ncbi:MAG: DUF481 domain-containing protein [Verrucomicrobiae bacterium]|nr:DUF481 domain-containing protein [Verrucomicrobiae bacterium]
MTKSAFIAGAIILLLAGVVPPTAEADRKQRWDSSVALGLNLTSGNSDTVLLTLELMTEREYEHDFWRLGATAAYGETEGDKTTQRARGFGEYQRLLNERWYVGANADLIHDDVADVNYRLTLSPVTGYYFIKSDRTRLSGEMGPSFVFEKTGGDEQQYISLRFAERFEHQFNERAKVWQSAEIFPQVDDWENFLLRAEAGAEAALNAQLSLRAVLRNEYDNQPPPDRKRNDLTLTSALVYKF